MKMNSVEFDGVAAIPSKIVCVGRNYVEHISELGNDVPDQMVVFMKPNSAITSQLQAFPGEPVNYEAEISFLIIDGEIAAVGAGLDLTKRDAQSELKQKGLPWERAKAFDGSALFSPFVAIDSIDDTLEVLLQINHRLVQQGGVSLMIHKPADIMRECRQFISFNDGDIIMTGTPRGVGVVKPGDHYEIRIRQNGRVITRGEWRAT